MALANNPDMQRQRMNHTLSENDLAEKKSQNFGQFGLVASYGHYNLPRTLAPLTPASILSDPYAVPTTQDLFTTGIMYEVPLFTGFAQQRSVEIAVMQKEMAGVGPEAERRAVDLQCQKPVRERPFPGTSGSGPRMLTLRRWRPFLRISVMR